MKKFLALCLCLSFCCLSVPSYACEVVGNEVMSTISSEQIMPRDVTVLWSTTNRLLVDYFSVKVYPDKGTNLKIIFNATDKTKIEVFKNGGWWSSKTITHAAGSGTQTYDLINNCNGEPYVIKFTCNTGCTFNANIVQTQYL